ncbi:hypothetical protein [Streptomyces sp. NPDC001348]
MVRLLTAPLRRPRFHVHVGAPLRLGSEQPQGQALAMTHSALTRAWRTAARRLGAPVLRTGR